MKIPHDYQEVAIDRMQQAPGFLLADVCGLGKTLTAIEVAKRTRQSMEDWLGMVICPKKLRAQWEDFIHDQDPGVSVIWSDYIPWDYTKIRGWVLVSYPELQGAAISTMVSVIWDIVVVDEAHRLKNRKSASADNAKKIPAARRIALTGTPWEAGHQDDVWSLLNFVRPDEFPSYWTFTKEWLEMEPDYFQHFKYGGPLDHEEFADMLSSFMIRRTKEEVRPDLPEKIITEVRVEMDEKQAKQYAQFKASPDIVVVVDNTEFLVQNSLTLITRLQQLSTDPSLIGLTGKSAKVQWLEEFIEDHPEPLVVFSRFRDIMIALANKYKGDLIIGGADDAGRDFVDGTTNIVFATIDSIEGVDGLQRAENAVFLDSHWSSIKMTQAIDRIHRINIDTPKNIYLLHACREDRLVLDALDKKWTEEELVYHFLHD